MISVFIDGSLLGLKSLLLGPVFLAYLTIHSIVSVFRTTMFLAEFTVLGGTNLFITSLVTLCCALPLAIPIPLFGRFHFLGFISNMYVRLF